MKPRTYLFADEVNGKYMIYEWINDVQKDGKYADDFKLK